MANDNLDDLMSGLLDEAKKGVEAEGKKIDQQAEARDQAERDIKAREESKKRDEAQQRVIEESRRRNEALAKRDRDLGERKQAQTAKHARVEPAAAVVVAPVAAPSAAVKPTSKILLAALVIAGLAVGAGGAFAMQPEMKGTFPDVDDAARVVIGQTARAALAEQKLNAQLADLNGQLTGLKGDLGTSGSDLGKLKADLEKAKKDLEKAKKDLEDVKAGATPKKTGTGTDDGVPKLDNSAFGKKPN